MRSPSLSPTSPRSSATRPRRLPPRARRLTPPPTSTSSVPQGSGTGNNLLLVLLALAAFGLVLGFVTPKPARARTLRARGGRAAGCCPCRSPAGHSLCRWVAASHAVRTLPPAPGPLAASHAVWTLPPAPGPPPPPRARRRPAQSGR